MSDDARFDPRFDPAFQPGYAGPIAAGPSAAKLVPAPPTALSAAPPAAPTAAPTAMSAEVSAAMSTVAAPLPDTTTDKSADGRRVNPFVIGLGVVSIVLILGGVYLITLLQQMFAVSQGSQTTFDYATFQALMYGAPLLIALGIATAIGVLFIFAVRWWRLQR